MKGILDQIVGIPLFEEKSLPVGTYVCMDEHGLPIQAKDLGKKQVVKIIVQNIETFKIAIKNNAKDTNAS